jgi:hypothetical protein
MATLLQDLKCGHRTLPGNWRLRRFDELPRSQRGSSFYMCRLVYDSAPKMGRMGFWPCVG